MLRIDMLGMTILSSKGLITPWKCAGQMIRDAAVICHARGGIGKNVKVSEKQGQK